MTGMCFAAAQQATQMCQGSCRDAHHLLRGTMPMEDLPRKSEWLSGEKTLRILYGGSILISGTRRRRDLFGCYWPGWVYLQPAMSDATVGRHVASRRNDLDSKVGLLSKSCEEGELIDAVKALDLLVQRRCYIDDRLLSRVLKRCTAQKDLVLGSRVHALAISSGYASSPFLANHVIGMYASHGRLEEAMQAFTKVAVPDHYMWASIILAHARHGKAKKGIKLYKRMLDTDVKPNNYVFVAVLRACAAAAELGSGKDVHADILRSENEPNVFVGNCLVDMYAKCGSLEDARRVFDHLPTRDVVTWNAMITAYAQRGLGQEAFSLYASMQKEAITSANHITFACLLQACARAGALHQGKQLHGQIQEKGLDSNLVVSNGLVDMYAKCGRLDDARSVFDQLQTRNIVTWNAMIAGYAQHGLGQEALALYACMQQEGMTAADYVTFVCLLQACGSIGAVNQGKQLHAEIQGRGLEADVVVGNCLVDMYAKCGSLKDARLVFDRLPIRDVVTWNALINCYAEYSYGQKALQCFKEMRKQGVVPDGTTFSSLLVACSHAGLVHEGQQYFKMMVEDHGILPTSYHYNCMVDLLGRSGHLDEAENLLCTTPSENDPVGWRSLLSACRMHGDLERGQRCFDHLITLVPENASSYALLANIYAKAGNWKDVERIETLRKSAGAKKKPAKACIEVKNKVHEFRVGEEISDISSKVRTMSLRLKQDVGYIPQIELVLNAVPEQEKEDALCGHAEKLALAYGLLNTPEGTPLLVTKNLRMCNDCHSSTKILSDLEKREIIVRDAHRIHRFVDGSCTCGDRN